MSQIKKPTLIEHAQFVRMLCSAATCNSHRIHFAPNASNHLRLNVYSDATFEIIGTIQLQLIDCRPHPYAYRVELAPGFDVECTSGPAIQTFSDVIEYIGAQFLPKQ
jgi:hypothetical protein